MGTNFYWLGDVPDESVDDPAAHIGKRSAAGWYCWDCDATLCAGGKARIHYGDGMLADCPQCGKRRPNPTGVFFGAAAVELGFASPETTRPTGVATCSSFTGGNRRGDGFRVLRPEYGRRMTGRAFLDMLAANCPVQFTHLIGQWFS